MIMYNIKMVSMLLDLPAVTIRAWENRYGVVDPIRDENGHRMYSDQDVADLRWLLEQTKSNGLSIKHAAKMLEEKRKSKDERGGSPQHVGIAQHSELLLKDKLYAVLLEVNSAEANRHIDLGFSMYEFDTMLHEILVPILVRIGDEWEKGIISVAQEHFATEVIKQRLFQFMRLFQHNKLYPKMLAACPSQERHEVGLLIFTLFMRRKGVEVVYLGPDVPVEGLIEMQARLNINYVLLSVTDGAYLSRHIYYMEQVFAANATSKFIVGGVGFTELKETSLPITILSGDVSQWDDWFQLTFPLQRK
jgi:DNA-binding transcriptional MerR regulator/methylmalonyl-CoA mutase cobalamin-binding subunit